MSGMYDALASFYDVEYGFKDDDLSYYLDAALTVGGPVLEIGVGTGRVALSLIQKNMAVVGIDSSANMLAIAEEKKSSLPGNIGRQLDLKHMDMARFSLPNQRFPLCIIPFRAFLHNLTQLDQISTLKRIHQHLLPGGVLTFDLFVPLYDVISRTTWDEELEPESLDDNLTVKTLITHTPALQHLDVENTYSLTDASGQVTKTRAHYRYRYIFRYEMEALLQIAGFKVKSVWGDFEKQPYNYSSGQMVFWAQKS